MPQTMNSIADVPRYGAATLNGPAPETVTSSTGGGIRWGGGTAIIKGIAIVATVALVGIGVWAGVGMLMGSIPSLSAAATTLGTAATTVGSQLSAGAAVVSTYATGTAIPWITGTAAPFVGNAIVSAGVSVLHGMSWVLGQFGLAGTATALAPATVNSTVAAAAGIAAAGVVAIPAAHAIHHTTMIDHAALEQIAEHVTHHAAHHTAEENVQSTHRPSTTSKTWADRVGQSSQPASIQPRNSNFAAQVDADSAKLQTALAAK